MNTFHCLEENEGLYNALLLCTACGLALGMQRKTEFLTLKSSESGGLDIAARNNLNSTGQVLQLIWYWRLWWA